MAVTDITTTEISSKLSDSKRRTEWGVLSRIGSPSGTGGIQRAVTEPERGVEPLAYRLRGDCSTTELLRREAQW